MVGMLVITGEFSKEAPLQSIFWAFVEGASGWILANHSINKEHAY